MPGTDAFFAHVALRRAELGIGYTRSHGLATDWGIQSDLVAYIARQRRTQLSVLLAGRGYFMVGERVCTIEPGDVVETDQRRHDMEGYAGSPCELLILDWEGDDALAPEHRGETRISHLAPRDVERLRAHCAELDSLEHEAWTTRLIDLLRALGLRAPRGVLAPSTESPQLARMYTALGEARARLADQPALDEIAARLGVSDRQVRRNLGDLDRDFGLNSAGWRAFLNDARLGYAQQLLSIEGLTIARVAELAGFRSPVALSHAFTVRAGITPGAVRRQLRARWG